MLKLDTEFCTVLFHLPLLNIPIFIKRDFWKYEIVKKVEKKLTKEAENDHHFIFTMNSDKCLGY